MQCGEARKHLYLSERQYSEGITFPVGAEIAQAEEHVAGCCRCREFFRSEKRLKEFLIGRLSRESVPAELHEAVATMLATQRNLMVNQLKSWVKEHSIAVAAAALVIMLAGAVAIWLSIQRLPAQDQQLASTLIDDHAHTPAGLAEIISSDHKAVESWFDGKIDFRFHLPPADDTSLLGGKICNLQGRHAALI